MEQAKAHPLDRCTGGELEHAVDILKKSGNLSDQAFFSSGFADEPDKSVVLNFERGNPFERVIRLIGHDPKQKQSFDARVSLTKIELVRFDWIEDGQVAACKQDVVKIVGILFETKACVDALRKRGIEDLSLVHVETWVAGKRHPKMSSNARMFSAIFFLHKHVDDIQLF
jgi:primary-amine oxidase